MVTIPEKYGICQNDTSHPESRWPWIDIAQLSEYDFILLKQGQKMRQNADRIFEQAGLVPKILLETGSAFTAYHLSREGYGLSFITDSYCVHMNYQQDGLAIFSVGVPCIKNKLVVAYPQDCHLSTAAKSAIDRIKSSIREKAVDLMERGFTELK